GSEDDLIAASLYESAAASEADIRRRVDALDPLERAELISELAGDRSNRRHRPGRGWEAVRYRFEIVSDYGGFRDLQRHRMLTCQWQRLGPDLGAGVPGEVREAGFGDEYERAHEVSRLQVERLEAAELPRAPRGPGAARGGAVRALPRLSDPLRARPHRARGDAPVRASLGARGPPALPRRRPGDARANRRRTPGDRRGDELRRHLGRAPPRADHERDPHPPPPTSGGARRLAPAEIRHRRQSPRPAHAYTVTWADVEGEEGGGEAGDSGSVGAPSSADTCSARL